jgi:hypothetical protein
VLRSQQGVLHALPARRMSQSSLIAFCSSCNLKQTQSSCHVRWMLHVVVKPSNEATKPSSLGDVMESLSAEIDLTTASEDNIIIALLSTKKVFKFTFDSQYQINEISDIQP